MTKPPDVEPVADDEILFRRIPDSEGWFSLSRRPPLDANAFRPNEHDAGGISLTRQKYATIERAAIGRPGKKYFVAVLRAGDIRAARMDVLASPLPDDPAHAEILICRIMIEGRDRRWSGVLNSLNSCACGS